MVGADAGLEPSGVQRVASAQSRALGIQVAGVAAGTQVVGGSFVRQGQDHLTPLPGQRREGKGNWGTGMEVKGLLPK